MKQQTLGIVGFGRFGRLAAVHLKNHFEVVVYDREDVSETAGRIGLSTGMLNDVANQSVVFLCVPISEIESVLEAILPHLAEGALVADSCSVKEYPLSLMQAILPETVDILGTHPLFGPDSAATGLAGMKIVVCPVRIRNLQPITAFLEHLKLRVLVRSPEDHDRRMAATQAVVQFLGRAFLEMGMTEETVATPGYERLMRILEVVQNDTWELFCDLQRFNRFAAGARERLIQSLKTVDQRLERSGPAGIPGIIGGSNE